MADGLSVTEQDDVVVVQADESQCTEIWKEIAPLAEDGKMHVVLDVGNVSYLNSMSIAAIISLRNKLIGMGGTLELANLQASIQNVFRILKLEKLFDLDQDLDAAVKSAKSA